MEQRASRIQMGQKQVLNGRIRVAPPQNNYINKNLPASKPSQFQEKENLTTRIHSSIHKNSIHSDKEYVYTPPASLRYSLWYPFNVKFLYFVQGTQLL